MNYQQGYLYQKLSGVAMPDWYHLDSALRHFTILNLPL
ncbi:hypothetical protein LCAUW4_2557 [Lacticaseibacillus casei UW4]|nr:hypothetical protein LCAUW4_2557 [Lacticaseibacillus casei UW4]